MRTLTSRRCGRPPPSERGRAASADQQQAWATAYSDALAKAPDGDPAKVASGDYGPVPVIAAAELRLADSGALEGLLTSRTSFFGVDSTKALLLLADGTHLEDAARHRTSVATSGAS